MQNQNGSNITITWNNAVQFFLQDCKSRNLTKGTIRRYRNGLEKLYQHLVDQQVQWHDLCPDIFHHRIIPSMLNEGLALRTVNCNLCIYKELFKLLLSEGWMESNIAITLKPFKVQPSFAHTFTDEQLHQLLIQPDRATFTGLRNYVMMLTLLDTGIRLKELANIQIQDVLFDEGVLRVQQGKGRKFRIVPIQHVLADTLNRYLLERGTLNHNFLWITLDNVPFREGGIRVMIARYCSTANIQGVQCSCHTFRHTFAKKYLMNGGDVFTLKSILGHERIETTEMYVELFSRDLQIQHEKFSPIEHLANDFPFAFDESEVSGE
ncbi:tyrosine-type recombinase/integrase [Paenibacillus sp. J5C_2022]|uniref:tyrosine-type recombinase/integrase n=1 Tax=Paenibacillus sp. J5C2022 TaxID=2977129 RepID=UPI0021CE39CB|nr:tyrosine-type recombinase/integrase [Paenibacillus sp. J5C2022]MCU6711557.1 tyrosine-type recombinase/integrase [Paenibacillus sp. J5C2022]